MFTGRYITISLYCTIVVACQPRWFVVGPDGKEAAKPKLPTIEPGSVEVVASVTTGGAGGAHPSHAEPAAVASSAAVTASAVPLSCVYENPVAPAGVAVSSQDIAAADLSSIPLRMDSLQDARIAAGSIGTSCIAHCTGKLLDGLLCFLQWHPTYGRVFARSAGSRVLLASLTIKCWLNSAQDATNHAARRW
jgi:hypothetical protein